MLNDAAGSGISCYYPWFHIIIFGEEDEELQPFWVQEGWSSSHVLHIIHLIVVYLLLES